MAEQDDRRRNGADLGLSTRAVYVISVAAELAGVHPQTLRIYERKGLLEPQRTVGGNRRYSEADLAAMRRIQELTASGVNLEGVRRILVLEREVERLGEALLDARSEMRDAVAETHRHYRRDLVPVRAERLPARRGYLTGGSR
jgi:MerR family transcriptional regulator, heat shock protein HspR